MTTDNRTNEPTEFLDEQKRLAEAWPAEQPEYMQYASEDLILSGNYDDAVREGFDAGVEWAEHRVKAPMLRLITALEAVMALHRKNLPEDGNCQGYGSMPGGYGYLDDWCVECSEQSGREYGADWPCATYRAIEAALGGEGDDC